ncbi:MAG: cellulase family glycosylhydrolase [Acidobacteria bacterium]|nr:cellulase family glycosylhydrolase [Acidobacteriota bacterium]
MPPSTKVRVLPLFLFALFLTTSNSTAQQLQISPPLHTDGYRILDSANHPVRLTSVNWYGFDEKEYIAGGLDHAPLAQIIQQIKQIGVNSVRLPWANETLERNPLPPAYAIGSNPQFKNMHAMEIMDAVVSALANAHIMVILDNHVSRADWCCSETDGNGLWYNADYPEDHWLADWKTIAHRYRNQPWVVGADLRNELRSGAAWGGSDPKLDWHAAAERGGKAVLSGNPRLLIMVEGPEYSTNLSGFDKLPVHLPIAHRLVYSPHAYHDQKHPFKTVDEMKQGYEARVGYLMHAQPAVPLWIGEFGTCQKLDCGANSDWFRLFIQLLQHNDQLSWSYWPLNGNQSSGMTRKYDAVETYGLLSPDYKSIAAPEIVNLLHTIEAQPSR